MSGGCDFFGQVAAVVESLGVHNQSPAVHLDLNPLNGPVVIVIQSIR
jgi:hypothetical protein